MSILIFREYNICALITHSAYNHFNVDKYNRVGTEFVNPFVADFSLNFTTCVGHSEAIPCGYKARITNGRLSSVPEATPLVLLGLGIVFAGFGHKTLFLHSGLCAWLWCHALLMMCRS